MQSQPIQLSDVIYNAGTQNFEALVTVHDGAQTRKYACAIQAPITMSFTDAAAGLRKQAMRRHANHRGLLSTLKTHTAKPRAGRAKLDPMRWLEQLVSLPGRRAA